EGADLVINLAGKSVNCRYNAKNKKEILDSRIDATRAVGQAIREATVPPKVWINAASATIYRHAEDRPQDEYNGEFQQDFSVQVCKLWEKTFEEQRTPFTRRIVLRMAITLGRGGVMTPLLTLLKFGLGGKQGNGKQMFSWIHIADLCRAVEWLADNRDAEGIYNVCSPFPLSNRTLLATLRKVTGHRMGLPAPGWLLKIGAALIGTETELILKSRWVLPSRLLKEGFDFHYAGMDVALREIVGQMPRKKYHLF
ncbi:MAG: TIGR01777 family oxidoreductase, partial [Bacteroidota bacterium]|nr:TIGR01777 family oxidoreductase [Bacteroidota bacterium]